LTITFDFERIRHPGVGMENEAPRPYAGLPGNAISFYIVPLDSAPRAELAGHVAGQGQNYGERRILHEEDQQKDLS
jgi:hypothetical protein